MEFAVPLEASPQQMQDVMPTTIGFDIGGTNLRAAVVRGDGTIVERMQTSSDGSVKAVEDGIVRVTERLYAMHPEAQAVGLAVAGFLDKDRQRVRFAPHLPWRDADVVARLSPRLPVPLELEHDANSAAWGEYKFGVAQNVDNWVLFAVGTGIGGAMMHNGEIFRGAYGTAPEFGHLTVVPNGRPCSCGKRGCLERYCSGTALAATACELASTRRFATPLVESCLRGEVTGTDVMVAARNDDRLAVAAVQEFAHWLGQGLALVADIFDPELIVIGGGVAQAADQYLDTATALLGRYTTGAGYRPLPRVDVASLGVDAGLIGAANIAATSVVKNSRT
ncbi:ROK family protein [Corynebacterium sp. H113]|uniref:ROK family protein n=1 Tax=Corynebacterium sp. H113 TaxID=3133419 RepID=UPI00403FC98D